MTQATRPPPRRRRPSAKLRTLVLDAARELFLERGYDGATTKHIADKAGVSERVLFNQFGSKAALFKAAIVTPFADFVADYDALWNQGPARDQPDPGIDKFASGLYDLAVRHRAVLLSCIAATLGADSNVQREVLDELARILQRMIKTADDYSAHHGMDWDSPAVVATSAATVLGVALLDDLLFPRGTRRPSRQRLINEIEHRLHDSYAPKPS